MKPIDILADLIEELNDYAGEIRPVYVDYYYQGASEQMVLDKKKEIADELSDIVEKYAKLYNNFKENF